jgi:uncharacterized UPF0160 family protein
MAAAGDGGAPAPPSDADVDAVYLAVYKSFMEAVDAIDNGVNQYESDAPPRYVNGTTLSSRVGGLNPAWNEDQSNEAMDAAFTKAVALTWSEFEDAVRWMARAWLPARGVVVAAMDGAKGVDASGAIVELATPCPWKEHLYTLEEERGCVGSVKFVIYRDDREGKWRVQAVSKAFVSVKKGGDVGGGGSTPKKKKHWPTQPSFPPPSVSPPTVGTALPPSTLSAVRAGV